MKNFSKDRYLNSEPLSKNNVQFQHFFDKLIRNSTSIYYEYNIEGYYKFVSPQVKTILGYDAAELKIKWNDLLTDNPINKNAIEISQKAINTGRAQPPYEIEVNTKEGKKIMLEIREFPVVENGKTVSMVGTSIDITESRKAELEIQQLALIHKEIDSGILTTDINKNVEWINKGFSNITGFSIDDVIGKKLSEFLFSEEKDDYESGKLLSALEYNKSFEVELKLPCNGGSAKWVQINLKPVFNEQNDFVKYFGILIDIDQRKKVEEAHRYSEEKFSKAFLASPESYTLTTITDGKIIELNAGFENIFGYSREEALGKSTIELNIWKNISDREAVISLLRQNGSVRNYTAEYNAKNGSAGIAEVSMELVTIREQEVLLTIVRDITERKRVERELEASEEKFSTAFYLSPDANAIARLSNGEVLDCNHVFEQIFEFQREEIIGKTTTELGIYKNIEDRAKVYQLLAENNIVRNFQTEFITKNKKTGFAQLSIDKISIDGEVCLLISVRDITEQKRIQTEIEEYQKQLKNLSSEIILAEEKERRKIAGNLHDHLSQSLAMAKIKLTDFETENLSPSNLEKINDAKNFLNTAISNSRQITYELSPPILYDLGFLAAVKWRLDEVAKNHKITTELLDETDFLSLEDEVRVLLFRAVLEIINNSLKHSKASKLTVLIRNDNSKVYINVSDNGNGFNPKTALKEAVKNRSFGIFSIRERISYLGGTMAIDSIIGKGTEVKIQIPYEKSFQENGDSKNENPDNLSR